MNVQGLATYSIQRYPQGDRVLRILQEALQAVNPATAVQHHLQRKRAELVLFISDAAGYRTIDLRQMRRVRLVALGKAAVPMAFAAAEILGPYLTDGIVITKHGYLDQISEQYFVSGRNRPDQLLTNESRLILIEAGHPLPDQRSIQAAQKVQAFLKNSKADDLVLVFISGGGSALLVSPAPGISLADIQLMSTALLACGANIHQINAVRKHIDGFKGGGLARLAAPAQIVSLILSDVVGDPLDVIASGPTVPDSSTFRQALQSLECLESLSEQASSPEVYSIPDGILRHLQLGQAGVLAETPKADDPLFDNVTNILIGSNYLAAQAALEKAGKEGFNCLLLTTYLQGEARQAGIILSSLLRQVNITEQPIPRPACIIAGGETTVTLNLMAQNGTASLGGRNQELALGSVSTLEGLTDVLLVALATDGGDGPTDAAGAVASGETMERARKLGLDARQYLQRNDSYHFFAALDDLLKPGPTHTNVNDLILLFAL